MSTLKAITSRCCSRRWAIGFLILALAGDTPLRAGQPHPPRAERHESRRAIDHLEDSWRNALMRGNVASMDALLADDYMAITPSGVLQSKEQTLASMRSGTMHFASIDITDRKVRFYGQTALVNCRADVSGTTSDGDITGSYRYTRVYVRDARGVWRIVSFEASRIREPGEHK